MKRKIKLFVGDDHPKLEQEVNTFLDNPELVILAIDMSKNDYGITIMIVYR